MEGGNESIGVTEIDGEDRLEGERLFAHFDDVADYNATDTRPDAWNPLEYCHAFDNSINIISSPSAITHTAHVEVETRFEIENVISSQQSDFFLSQESDVISSQESDFILSQESDVILSQERDPETVLESGIEVEVESDIARDNGVEVPNESDVQLEVDVAMTHAIACPPGYESDVFYSLPEFMQQEILDQHEEENGSDQVRTLVESQGYDYETFSSLPESIRVEILDQARRDQATSTGGSGMPPSDTANSQEMDNASFLVSLSAELRAEVLLTADAAFILSLPPELVAEAQMHRERAAAHWQQREIQQTRLVEGDTLHFALSITLILSLELIEHFQINLSVHQFDYLMIHYYV